MDPIKDMKSRYGRAFWCCVPVDFCTQFRRMVALPLFPGVRLYATGGRRIAQEEYTVLKVRR